MLSCVDYNNPSVTVGVVSFRVGGGSALGYGWRIKKAFPSGRFINTNIARYLSEFFVLDSVRFSV